MSPLRSSSWKQSQVAQCGTRFELAISTRGASACVRKTPTGLPDWTSSVSIALEPLQRGDDAVEALPIARGPPDAAIDHELARPLGDLGVEIVHEHAQRRFGQPALGGELGPAGRECGEHCRCGSWGFFFLRASRRRQQARSRMRGKSSWPAASARASLLTSSAAAAISGARNRSSSRRGTRALTASRTRSRTAARAQRSVEIASLRRREKLDGEDVRDILRHGEEAARAMRRHRDMIFLIGGGRDRIDARRIGPLLVLRDERRRRHLGDHEAGIEPRLRRRGRRAAATRPGRRAWRCAARKASRFRKAPARACRRRRPPARRGNCRRRAISPLSAKIERVVGDAIGLDRQASRRRGASRSRQAPITCGWQRRQ